MKKQIKWLSGALSTMLVGIMMLTPVVGMAEESVDAALAPQEGIEMPADVDAGKMAPGGPGGMNMGMMPDMKGTQNALTEEQQQALDNAQAEYDAAEDALLMEMVAAQAITQDAVNAYQAQRTAQRQVADIDYAQWTLDQMSQLRDALAKTGDERDAALNDLVQSGVLSQNDADMLKTAYVQSMDIWSQVDTTKATQEMMNQLTQARQKYQQALVDAGINGGMGRGMNGGGQPGSDMRGGQGDKGKGTSGKGN